MVGGFVGKITFSPPSSSSTSEVLFPDATGMDGEAGREKWGTESLEGSVSMCFAPWLV